MYYVYILTNQRNTVLYTGITNNLPRRMSEHRRKLGHHFTQRYHCTKLVYYEGYQNALDAIHREKQIKAGSRFKKEALINQDNPQWENKTKLPSGLPRRSRNSSSQ